MSTRNRKQPVSFKIPDSQGTRFKNLTKFRGLEVSSNPFDVNIDSASELLNLYVDESGALTTRPRLEKKYDFGALISSTFEYLGIYQYTSGYLIHGKEGTTYKMYRFITSTNTLTQITASGTTIPTAKCKVFEQNELIYLLDGTTYRKITNTTLTSVLTNPYIPTTQVGKTNLIAGSSFESLNLLTSSYKESYFWDGTWNPEDIFYISKENNYHRVKKYQPSLSNSDHRVFKYASDYYDEINPTRKEFLVRRDDDTLGMANSAFEQAFAYYSSYSLDKPSVLPVNRDMVYGDCTPDGKIVAWLYRSLSYGGGINAGGLYVNRNGTFYTVVSDTTHSFYENPNTRGNVVMISDDGNMVVSYTPTQLVIGKFNATTDSYDVTYVTYDTSGLECIGIDMSSSGNVILLKLKTLLESGISTKYVKLGYIKGVSTTEAQTLTFSYIDAGTARFQSLGISYNGNYMILPFEGNDFKARVYTSFNSDDSYTLITNIRLPGTAAYTFSKDLDKLYFFSIYESGWLLLNETFDKINIDITGGIRFWTNEPNQMCYATADEFILLGLTEGDSDPFLVFNKFDYNNIEPLLIVTKTVDSTHEEYSSWSALRTKFLKSFLFTRFDNRLWFGSGNSVFYTENTLPEYIPKSNYSDLGNTKEYLTGFNLVGDDLLVAYKNKHIYLIQGTTLNEQYTYLFSESKNTVGNDAYDATIISSLNEIPLQITYSGIYGLNQVENIQSSDRISVLLSENINSLWLKETQANITNCKTLNYLYWTFLFLNDTTITKVYILDNRTNDWFYWELPIVVLSVYNINEKVTIVDAAGKIYTMETTDIIRDYDTEYYDDEKVLINWKWVSQINHLGTINYLKQLKSTSFIVADSDSSDGYALNYSFKIFRKNVSEGEELTAEDTLNYITTVTKRTYISRFNFIQLKLTNITNDYLDDCYKNNKIRLIGLSYKYILSENTI